MVMAIDLLYQTTVVLLQLYVSYVNLHLLRSQISIDYRDEFQSDIRVQCPEGDALYHHTPIFRYRAVPS